MHNDITLPNQRSHRYVQPIQRKSWIRENGLFVLLAAAVIILWGVAGHGDRELQKLQEQHQINSINNDRCQVYEDGSAICAPPGQTLPKYGPGTDIRLGA